MLTEEEYYALIKKHTLSANGRSCINFNTLNKEFKQLMSKKSYEEDYHVSSSPKHSEDSQGER